MALPGGFIEQREYLLDACLRKLREETGLNLAETLLKASIQNKEVFDSPSRSERGRTISHVFYFSLPNEVSLADVGVEASEVDAFWLPLANLNSVKMFEDHYFIIQKIVGMT